MKPWEIPVLILVCAIAAIFLWQLIRTAGFRSKNKRHGFRWEPEQSQGGLLIERRETSTVFVCALLFRVLVYLLSILVLLMFLSDEPLSVSSFLNHWRQWDASNYIAIAENGYAGSLVDGQPLFLVFFPLYAYAIRIMSVVTGSSLAAALLVSSLSYAGGCCYFYKLAAYDYGKEKARTAVILISVFPFGFFFGAMMSEGMFFFLTAAALYYIRRHQWPVVALFGALACMTRMHGILLLIPAFAELVSCEQPIALLREKKFSDLWKIIYRKAVWPVLMLAGTVYYLLLNYAVTGNAFQFTVYQREHWYQAPTLFTKTLEYVFRNAFTYDPPLLRAVVWIPEAFLFLAGIAVLIYALPRKKKKFDVISIRHRSMYTLYLFAYLLLNYSVSWLLSGGRYMSCAIPLFLLLADMAENRKVLKIFLIAGSAVLFGIYMTGYLFGMHIM